jgi:putative peptide zinc metalloprotease protein
VFKDPELEDNLATAENELVTANQLLQLLQNQKVQVLDQRERDKIDEEMNRAKSTQLKSSTTVKTLKQIAATELILHAPRDGVIGTAPRPEDIGKMFEASRDQAQQAPPIFTIHEPGCLRVCMPVETNDYNRLRENILAAEKEKATSRNPRPLEVTVRVHGLGSERWSGTNIQLDASEAKTVPVALSNRGGGPVPVNPPSGKSQGLVPQTQQYMVYIDIANPSPAITVGTMAQVKVHCRPETCMHWLWRKANNVFNLRLL